MVRPAGRRYGVSWPPSSDAGDALNARSSTRGAVCWASWRRCCRSWSRAAYRAIGRAWVVDLLLPFATATAYEQGTRDQAAETQDEEDTLAAVVRDLPADLLPPGRAWRRAGVRSRHRPFHLGPPRAGERGRSRRLGPSPRTPSSTRTPPGCRCSQCPTPSPCAPAGHAPYPTLPCADPPGAAALRSAARDDRHLRCAHPRPGTARTLRTLRSTRYDGPVAAHEPAPSDPRPRPHRRRAGPDGRHDHDHRGPHDRRNGYGRCDLRPAPPGAVGSASAPRDCGAAFLGVPPELAPRRPASPAGVERGYGWRASRRFSLPQPRVVLARAIGHRSEAPGFT